MSWVVWAYEVSDPGPEPKQWRPAWLVTEEGIDPDQPPEGYFDIFCCETEDEARQLQSDLNATPPEDTRRPRA